MTTLPRWLLLLLAALLAACAPRPADPWQSLRQPDGSVLWLGEYRFAPPPPPWQAIDLGEGDASLAFYQPCRAAGPGETPCEATMAFAEEPFGYSRDFEPRAREFLKRYLWAARVTFSAPQLTPATVNGREALVVRVTGEEPVRGHRVHAKIVFLHRGERIVAFFCNQWRSGAASFGEADFAEFDRFVASFRFVRPSFYETL